VNELSNAMCPQGSPRTPSLTAKNIRPLTWSSPMDLRRHQEEEGHGASSHRYRRRVADLHPLLDPGVLRVIESVTSDHFGRAWTSDGFTDLSARASHPTGILRGQGSSVFAKLSPDPGGGELFDAELRGLRVLHERANVAVPSPIGPGRVRADDGWLLLYEAIAERPLEHRTGDDWRAIGLTLGTVHQVRNAHFGLEGLDGFFGPLPQDNSPVVTNTWADFYSERRLLPYLRSAVDAGFLSRELAGEVERLAKRLPILCGPEPPPTLLHGDAQLNNFITTDTGAVVVDVAPYFGHPEVDLALLDCFRPMPDDVLGAYREVLPIDAGFVERRELWRVFCYLAGIAVDGDVPFGPPMVRRLADALRQYR
jgi:fructosamine-3-kinase